MKKIGIITSTRAEYGLLQPVIQGFRKHESEDFKVDLIVTGTHLSEKHGYTVSEIEKSGERIDFKIPVKVDSGNANCIAENEADTLVRFTELFAKEQYSAIVILGDRYEILMVALAAVNASTPIFHIGGGDTTEGAADECFRHAITKMSYLHFPSNQDSYNRIIQMGEDPQRVFNVGSTGVDNILNEKLIPSKEVLKDLGIVADKYAICTYHPTTIGEQNVEDEMSELVGAMAETKDLTYIVTKANSDLGGDIINRIWEKAEDENENIHLFSSLGMKRYLSLLKDAEFMIGNSSSGIIEAPAMRVPTINIGNRQRGRLQSKTIINCNIRKADILEAIKITNSQEMKDALKQNVNPYGDGKASERIVEHSILALKSDIDLRKKFITT